MRHRVKDDPSITKDLTSLISVGLRLQDNPRATQPRDYDLRFDFFKFFRFNYRFSFPLTPLEKISKVVLLFNIELKISIPGG